MAIVGTRYRMMILLMLGGLAGCGEARPLATVQPAATARPAATATLQPQALLLGKWRVASVSQNGQLEPASGSDGEVILEFARDGSMTISAMGAGQEPQKGTYTLGDDGQLTMELELITIQGRAEIKDDQFVLAYDEPRPRSNLRQVNAQGTPIDAAGTPVAEPSPVMDHMVMTFDRAR